MMPMPVLDIQKPYWCLPKSFTTSKTAFLGLEGRKLEVCVRSGSRSESLSEWVRELRSVKAFFIRSPVLGRINVACRNWQSRQRGAQIDVYA